MCQIKFYPLVDIFCTSDHLSANKYLNEKFQFRSLEERGKRLKAAIDNYTFCLSFLMWSSLFSVSIQTPRYETHFGL